MGDADPQHQPRIGGDHGAVKQQEHRDHDGIDRDEADQQYLKDQVKLKLAVDDQRTALFIHVPGPFSQD